MQRIATPALDARLQRRYLKLVQSHLHVAQKAAAGIASVPEAASAFASTQAAWRFLNNDRVKLPTLAEPLREVGRQRVATLQCPFALLVHDWSKLSFNQPRRKRDLVQLTHESDVGYELTLSLLVSADNGQPLAPMEMELFTGEGVLSTRDPAPRRRPHLEQVLPTMQASAAWGLAKPLVHVIDREADSVDHYRRWDKAGHKFLIRADDRRVRWQDREFLLREIAQKFRQQQKFQCVGPASYQGRPAQLWVAETTVVLHRPAKKSVRGRKYEKPGRPLELRLIVVQLRNGAGKLLAIKIRRNCRSMRQSPLFKRIWAVVVSAVVHSRRFRLSKLPSGGISPFQTTTTLQPLCRKGYPHFSRAPHGPCVAVAKLPGSACAAGIVAL
jgi:hypothetical protein